MSRMLRRRFKKEYDQFEGNAEEICKQIVEQCWNGKFFQTSLGHFSVFFMRDFGMCCEALLNLGYRMKVIKSLDYALQCFFKHNKIGTDIALSGVPLYSFDYPSDSLPFLLRSLRLAKADSLLEKYREFLQKKIFEYKGVLLDEKKGIVKANANLSTSKDHYHRPSCMYANSMLGMVNVEIERINKIYRSQLQGKDFFENPFAEYNLKKIMKKTFWNGIYFYDDLFKEKYVAGDANIFPFYCNVFDAKHDKAMLLSCIHEIIKTKLDIPVPIKYTNHQDKKKEIWPQTWVSPNYEGDTNWAHVGLCYMYVISEVDKKLLKKYVNTYEKQILKYKNFLELYNPDGTPYKAGLYNCDEGMLWAAMWLDLKRKVS